MKWLLIKLLRFYQVVISPVLGSSCRFAPTCSHYAIEAVEKWGAWRGSIMTIKRLLRCHPWGDSGYDPVPEPPKCDCNKKTD